MSDTQEPQVETPVTIAILVKVLAERLPEGAPPIYTPKVIYRLLRSGLPHRRIGRTIYIRVSAFDEFMALETDKFKAYKPEEGEEK